MRLIDEVAPLEGARELIEDLKDGATRVVLASSAKEQEVDHYLDLLDARDLADGWTTSADVEAHEARARSRHGRAREARHARRGDGRRHDLGHRRRPRRPGSRRSPSLTGGFSEAELRDAGALAVFSRSSSCART